MSNRARDCSSCTELEIDWPENQDQIGRILHKSPKTEAINVKIPNDEKYFVVLRAFFFFFRRTGSVSFEAGAQELSLKTSPTSSRMKSI